MTNNCVKNNSVKTVVISAVNLVEGGGFSVLVDCLRSLAIYNNMHYRVIAIVNQICQMPVSQGIEYEEIPWAKKRYLYRFFCEYIYFKRISKRYNPILWLSLHDMSPIVSARVQAVYMHNPTPFYKPKLIDWKFLPINAVWAYLYKYLYKINIHSNQYLIVQQQWLRDEFSKMFSFPMERIIVARPESQKRQMSTIPLKKDTDSYVFFYPAYPRVFKNFDVICEAARILERKEGKSIRIVLTVDGSENKYSKYLVDKYSDNTLIDFIGIVDQSEMQRLYANTDCLLFPSKLETWGLPLSEFKPYNRPMIVSDLPYAHESVAGAEKVRFFNPDDAKDLASAMEAVAENDFSGFNSIPQLAIEYPSTNTWEELFDFLLYKE